VKKQICMVGALLSVLTMLSVLPAAPTVLASHPTPPSSMFIMIGNSPENAVFADILIRINERDPNFTAVNEDNLALFGLDTHAEIVGFNDNGFMSFTFHYIDASAEIYLSKSRMGINVHFDGSGEFHFVNSSREVHFGFGEKAGFRTQFHDLHENYQNMKIALLDYSGNVLSVSAEFSLPDQRRGVWISGSFGGGMVWYNHENGEITVDWQQVRYNYLGNILHPIIFAFDPPILFLTALGAMVLFLMILELVVGLCFGFRGKNLIRIVPTSLITLFFIVAFYFSFYLLAYFGVLVFFLTVILLIAATYRIKFSIYRDSPAMKDIISPRRILQHTITANTVSLAFLAGLFLIISWRYYYNWNNLLYYWYNQSS